MTPNVYKTEGPRKGPNGSAPVSCKDIDHSFRKITGFVFCVRCNMPYALFLGAGVWFK